MNAPAETPDRLRDALRALVQGTVPPDPWAVVPGSACLAALLFPLVYEGRVTPPLGLSRVIAFGALAWVLGLLCGAVGRGLRRSVSKRLRPRGALHARLVRTLGAHGLRTGLTPDAPGPSAAGLDAVTSAERLLDRCEALLRGPGHEASHRACERTRAVAAAHDGLAAALLVAAAVAWLVPPQVPRWPLSWDASLVAGGVALALAVVCWVEAHRLDRRRLDEVVAAVAVHVHGLPPSGAAARPA